MTPRSRWITAIALSLTTGCGVQLPPIEIVVAPPVNATPPAPTVPSEPAEPAPPPPEPPAVELPPLVNLNVVVQDPAGRGIPTAACAISGATESGQPESRNAHGAGDINFAVRGTVVASCSAPGFQTRLADLPPGDHRFPLERVAQLPPAKPIELPAPEPAGDLCVDRERAPLECVRRAAAKYAQLLTINTFESCVEFTQRVLELLGPDWGHVGKTAREGQSVPKGFAPLEVNGFWITGVSHDAIKHRVSGQVVDLLGNATANEPCDPAKLAPGEKCWKPGPASIQWSLIPAQYWRESNPFVPAVPVR